MQSYPAGTLGTVLIDGVRLPSEVIADLGSGSVKVRTRTWAHPDLREVYPRGSVEHIAPVQEVGEPQANTWVPDVARQAADARPTPAPPASPGSVTPIAPAAQGPRPSEVLAAVKALEAKIDALAQRAYLSDALVRILLESRDGFEGIPPSSAAKINRLRAAFGIELEPEPSATTAPAAEMPSLFEAPAAEAEVETEAAPH